MRLSLSIELNIVSLLQLLSAKHDMKVTDCTRKSFFGWNFVTLVYRWTVFNYGPKEEVTQDRPE